MIKSFFLFFLLFLFPVISLAALIDINTAGLADLDKIPEVGPVIAQRIIDYRSANGSFKTVEEIKNVKGIGEATFAKMKDFITIGLGTGTVSGDDDQTGGGNEQEKRSDDNNKGDKVGAGTGDQAGKSGSFKINIGQERLASVRTPINFSVSANKKGKTENAYYWSFGDGTSASGLKATHAYQYPGRYNVVLNAVIDQDEEAVARTTVLVVETKIKISQIDPRQGYVEIANNGDREQNLNNWKLKLDNRTHTFPADTIISPKSTIKIPVSYLGFDLSKMTEIALTYPDGGVVSKAIVREGFDPTEALAIQQKLGVLKKQLSLTKTDTNPGKKVQSQASPARSNVIVLKKELGWFEKIKNAIFE